MSLAWLPIAGVLASVALFGIAASSYPGGYDWRSDFISTLFAPRTATGAANEARPFAVAAMLVACLSVAVAFVLLSRRASSRVHGKIMEIGGIGTAVYSFLVVTPMHDLLVGIALLFYFPAMIAAIHQQHLGRRPALAWTGLLCLGLLSAAAAMYYGNVLWHLLPIAQKASMAACLGWLLAVQLLTEQKASNVEGAQRA